MLVTCLLASAQAISDFERITRIVSSIRPYVAVLPLPFSYVRSVSVPVSRATELDGNNNPYQPNHSDADFILNNEKIDTDPISTAQRHLPFTART